MFILYFSVLIALCFSGLAVVLSLANPRFLKNGTLIKKFMLAVVGVFLLVAPAISVSHVFKYFGDELYNAKLEARAKFEKEAISKQNPKKPVASFLFATEKLCFEEKFSSKEQFKNFEELSRACMKESLVPFEKMVAASNKNPEVQKSLDQAKKLLADRTAFESDLALDTFLLAGKNSLYKHYKI